MAANAKATTDIADALSLLTDEGAHTFADSVRSLRIVNMRLEPMIKEMIRTNRAVIAAQQENTRAHRENSDELRKTRIEIGRLKMQLKAKPKNGNGSKASGNV
jgi:hypothetical protein